MALTKLCLVAASVQMKFGLGQISAISFWAKFGRQYIGRLFSVTVIWPKQVILAKIIIFGTCISLNIVLLFWCIGTIGQNCQKVYFRPRFNIGSFISAKYHYRPKRRKILFRLNSRQHITSQCRVSQVSQSNSQLKGRQCRHYITDNISDGGTVESVKLEIPPPARQTR